jgi:hypothetical protein
VRICPGGVENGGGRGLIETGTGVALPSGIFIAVGERTLNGKTYVSIASLRRLESGKAGLWVPNVFVEFRNDRILFKPGTAGLLSSTTTMRTGWKKLSRISFI